MFGLCLPSGETTLIFTNGEKKSIAFSDEIKPKEYIFNDDNILEWINHYGYENIDKIRYERNNRATEISMAEYYYENADKLKK